MGPFDSNGNYVEAWANDPSKWRSYTPKEVDGDPPKFAKNEQPPDHSVPLASGGAAPATYEVARSRPTAGRTVAGTTPKSKSHASAAQARNTSRSDSEREVITSTTPKSTSSTAKTKSKTKSTSSSTAGRHTVKAGDSLSSIASSHGTTVTALKKANGLSGDMIRDGRTLVIPRRK